MKPWELLYHFYRLGKSKHFTLEEQAMYSHLVWLAWESGKWNGLQVTNNRMKDFIGKKDDRSIEKPRNNLIQLGLIKYSKGKKGSPSKYTLLPVKPLFSQEANTEKRAEPRKKEKTQGFVLKEESTVNFPPQLPPQVAVEPVAHIKKRKREDEDKPPISSFNNKEYFAEVAVAFAQCKGNVPTPFDEKKIKEWLNQGATKEKLLYAFEESALRDRFHWGYINQVIKNKGEEEDELTEIATGPTNTERGNPSKAEPLCPFTTTCL